MEYISFLELAQKVIDVLLGSDHYKLMFRMKEIRCEGIKHSVRLCPLGWTVIGNIGREVDSDSAVREICKRAT